MTAPAEALRGAVAFLLLPLSLVPLYFAVPRLRNEVAPDPDRAPLAAPDVTPSKAQLQRWRPLPPARDAVPVLAYHGVNDKPDHYSVTSRQFAEQMEMLRQRRASRRSRSRSTCASCRGSATTCRSGRS